MALGAPVKPLLGRMGPPRRAVCPRSGVPASGLVGQVTSETQNQRRVRIPEVFVQSSTKSLPLCHFVSLTREPFQEFSHGWTPGRKGSVDFFGRIYDEIDQQVQPTEEIR